LGGDRGQNLNIKKNHQELANALNKEEQPAQPGPRKKVGGSKNRGKEGGAGGLKDLSKQKSGCSRGKEPGQMETRPQKTPGSLHYLKKKISATGATETPAVRHGKHPQGTAQNEKSGQPDGPTTPCPRTPKEKNQLNLGDQGPPR